MKATADLLANYYERHPGISITQKELLRAVNKEGAKMKMLTLRGGMRILIKEEYAEKDEELPYDEGYSFKLVKLGYVSKNIKISNNASENSKKRQASKERAREIELEELNLKKRMMSGDWLCQTAT